MFRSDEKHRYFKVTFAGPSQAVLRRCAAALQSRFESRQRPIWDWAMDFGSMSGEGAFVLLSWPAKSPTTYTNAYQTVSRHIGDLCDDWQLRPQMQATELRRLLPQKYQAWHTSSALPLRLR